MDTEGTVTLTTALVLCSFACFPLYTLCLTPISAESFLCRDVGFYARPKNEMDICRIVIAVVLNYLIFGDRGHVRRRRTRTRLAGH